MRWCLLLAASLSISAVAFRVKNRVDADVQQKLTEQNSALAKHGPGLELKEYTNTVMKNAPLVVNRCKMSLVVYLQRGHLFNKQVIQPGEAAQLWSPQHGPRFLPYSIVAIAGDERSLPSDWESMVRFIGKVAVPTAFVYGVTVSVLSNGLLAPHGAGSVAGTFEISHLISGGGFAMAKAHISAGLAAAAVTEDAKQKLAVKLTQQSQELANWIVDEHPDAFMAKKKWVIPGTKYFEVVGGPDGASPGDPPALQINEITSHKYKSFRVEKVKVSDALTTRSQVGTYSFIVEGCGNPQVNGKWRMGPDNDHRPSYLPYKDVDLSIQWNQQEKTWRVITSSGFVFYESDTDSATVPKDTWKTVDGGGNAPTVRLATKFVIVECGDQRLVGPWSRAGTHNKRPQYKLVNYDEDNEFVIEYSRKRGLWRVTTVSGWRRTTLYKSVSDSKDVPSTGWKREDAEEAGPAPLFDMMM